jgi:UbiD family decarboxylase
VIDTRQNTNRSRGDSIHPALAEDGGFFNTLGLGLHRESDNRKHNLGIYRMQRYDEASDWDALADRQRAAAFIISRRSSENEPLEGNMLLWAVRRR